MELPILSELSWLLKQPYHLVLSIFQLAFIRLGYDAVCFQYLNNLRRLFRCNRFLNGFRLRVSHTGEQTELQDTEFYAGFLFYLPLKRVGKFRKALIRHNVQAVDVLVLNALPVLIDAQT